MSRPRPASISRRLLLRLLRRTGTTTIRLGRHSWVLQRGDGSPLHVDALGPQAWLVQSHPREPLEITQLERGSWLVEHPKRRRTVVRVGGKAMRTQLLTARNAARRDMRKLQNRLGDYLGVEYVAWLLDRMAVTCVLDVGANRGQFAQQLRETGYTGRIVSFEPVARFAAQLEAAAEGDPDWRVMRCALGDQEGTAEINVGGTVSSLLPASGYGRARTDNLRRTTTETIRIRRLESVFGDAVEGLSHPRVYLKMDTQGFDLATFRGAGSRIREVVALQSELSYVPLYEGMPHHLEQVGAYEAEGFAVSGIFPVTRDVPTLRVVESDLVMVRPDAVPAPADVTRPPTRRSPGAEG